MNKRFYSKVEFEAENLTDKDLKMCLEYYLTENTYSNDYKNAQELKSFGIGIVKKQYLCDEIVNIEYKSAEHLSLDKEKVEMLLEKLAKNTVTPISLYNVLDDLIGVSY